MTKSDLLRVQDVRDAYRLIGECRDLGNDPTLWPARMVQGLHRLLGAEVTGGEARLTGPERAVAPVSAFDAGLDIQGRRVWAEYMRNHGPALDPVIVKIRPLSGRPVTRNRRQVVSDGVYHRSPVYDNYLRVGGVYHRLLSIYEPVDFDAVICVHLGRPRREHDFSAREQRLLDFFVGELGPMVGRALVSLTEPDVEQLSPRLRQTLACLMQGDSEKQVAARLGISVATTHQYVTALYRHFRLTSRAQLLAHVFRRIGSRCL